MSENPILLYQAEDGEPHLEVLQFDETVWLTQRAMAELFMRDVKTINRHVKNIYDEGELMRNSTISYFEIVQKEGAREVSRNVAHYNLDMIVSVGYRVNSKRGTQFRIWATQKLTEYIKKGFVMNDDRLTYGDSRYFSELEERIRRIRTSEYHFYRKVSDVFTTSYDYDRNSEQARIFFATVQNKFHYAIHGHTAAELILERVGSEKINMGLTNWRHDTMTLRDAFIAKNYLTVRELKRLNLLVDQFLSYAQLQAMEQTVMLMDDWVKKLDDFIEFNEKRLLEDAGSVSRREMESKVRAEYEEYRKLLIAKESISNEEFVKRIEGAGNDYLPDSVN